MPNPPLCSDVEEKVVVSSRTNGSITLNFTKLLTNSKERICVQQQDDTDDTDHSNCKPANNTVPFYSLTASTLYHFSVYSYINDSVEEWLYSDVGCPFMRYTCKL